MNRWLPHDVATSLEDALEIEIRKAATATLAAQGQSNADLAFDHEIGFILARLAMRYGGPDLLGAYDAKIKAAIADIGTQPLALVEIEMTSDKFGTVIAVCPTGGRHGEYDPFCQVCDHHPRVTPRIAEGSTNATLWRVAVVGAGDPALHENIRSIVRAEMAMTPPGATNRARIEAGSFASRFGYEVVHFHVDDPARSVRVTIGPS